MAFSDLVSNMDSAVLATFGSNLTFTLHYSDGTPDTVVTGVLKNPALEEDYVPGSQQGVSVLLVFVRLAALAKSPVKGDTTTYGGYDYDIFQVDADREGGGTLRMRRRNQRFDQ